VTPPVRWTAGADQVAHATRRLDARTLCGLYPVRGPAEWPRTGYCEACVANLAPEEVPAMLRKAVSG
jgi:hypothetical protein